MSKTLFGHQNLTFSSMIEALLLGTFENLTLFQCFIQEGCLLSCKETPGGQHHMSTTHM